MLTPQSRAPLSCQVRTCKYLRALRWRTTRSKYSPSLIHRNILLGSTCNNENMKTPHMFWCITLIFAHHPPNIWSTSQQDIKEVEHRRVLTHGAPICSRWTTFSTTDRNTAPSSQAHRESQSGRDRLDCRLDAARFHQPHCFLKSNHWEFLHKLYFSQLPTTARALAQKSDDENIYNTLVAIWPKTAITVNKQPATAAILMPISRELLRPSGNPLLWLASTSASWEGVDEVSFPSCRCFVLSLQ